MPTPTSGSQYAIDGPVPGMTWDQFVNGFGTTNGGFSNPNGTNTLNGLPVDRQATGGMMVGGGQGDGLAQMQNPTGYQYRQYLPNGTSNWLSQGQDGSLQSKNTTDNSDSWWDSTGLPLVASLAFGGATAGLASAGVGVSGSGAGLANVGAGFGADSAAQAGANYAASNAGSLGSVGNTAGAANDIGSPNYDPYNPSNWTADAGTTASDASAAAPSAEQPSLWQQALNTAKDYGFGNGPIGSIQNIINGTGQLGDYVSAASTANSAAGLGGGGSSSDASNPFSSIVNQYAQTNLPQNGFGTYSAGQLGGLAKTGDYSQPLANVTAGTAGGASGNGGGGLLGSISNLWNNGITSGSASDYNNLLQAGLGIAGAVGGSKAAQTAANQQTGAINNANALTAAIYGDTVNRNAPFVKTGTTANNTLGDLYGTNGAAAQNTAFGNFQTSPDYKFAFDQGQRAVQSSAAAQGGLFSGRAAKDLQANGQGLASQQYGAYTNGLRNLSQTGQSAANNTATAGAGYSNQASNLLTAGGIAQSAGTIGSSNAITNALNQYLKNQASNGYYGT